MKGWLEVVVGTASASIHGWKVVASLKGVHHDVRRVGVTAYPRLEGRGLIEAAEWSPATPRPTSSPLPKGGGLIDEVNKRRVNPPRMSRFYFAQMVRWAKSVNIGAHKHSLTMAELLQQLCHFSCPESGLGGATSMTPRWTGGEMAELLMNSATVEWGGVGPAASCPTTGRRNRSGGSWPPCPPASPDCSPC